MALSFTDRSIARLEEKIKDVLIKVDKFIFFADFVILDYMKLIERFQSF